MQEKVKSKVLILVGYQGCGKDSVLTELVNKHNFNSYISHTSRPMRPNEVEGREYFFIDREDFLNKAENNYFVETRHYFTNVNGKRDIWYYGIGKHQVDKANKPSVIILDKQGSIDFAKYVGEDNVVLVYLELDEKIAKQRAILRGGFDEGEWNRRAKADKKSFKGIENMAHTSINTNRPLKDIIDDVLSTYEYYN